MYGDSSETAGACSSMFILVDDHDIMWLAITASSRPTTAEAKRKLRSSVTRMRRDCRGCCTVDLQGWRPFLPIPNVGATSAPPTTWTNFVIFFRRLHNHPPSHHQKWTSQARHVANVHW
jgi:hypothetical protein